MPQKPITQKPPKVSVVVPIYKVEKYLRQCVDSILGQTLKDIEVILVDDGSPDSCPQIVDEYAVRDSRVVPVHKKNGGLSSARNSGLERARGTYVGFVDADDNICPAMYEKLTSSLERSGADVAVCGIQCDFLSGSEKDVDQTYYDIKFEGLCPIDASLLEKLDVSVCNKLFKREIIESSGLRFPDGINFEDCEFFWRYALRSRGIFCIKEPLYHYLRHGGGIMKETMTGANASAIDAVLVCKNILKELLDTRRLKEFAVPFFLLLAGHYVMAKKSFCPGVEEQTKKLLKQAKFRKFLSILPEREKWAWEMLNQIDRGKKESVSKRLRYKIFHTKICKGSKRTFFCGIRLLKEKIPESDIVWEPIPIEFDPGTPKISVVIPIFNTEKYLRQCLDAVCAQTLKNIEIICVDDGSKDRTPQILEEYARKDSRIRVISKKNSGYGHSVNVGIDAARGEYLAIAEPDDYISPEMYEKLYDAAKKEHVPLVKCDWDCFWERDGKELRRERWRLAGCADETRCFCPEENPAMIADASGIWAGIYNLAWLRKNGIRLLETPGAAFQDTSFVLKTYFCARRMVCVPEPFVSYRQSNPNSSINAGSSKAFLVFKEFDEIIAFCKRHCLLTQKNKIILLKKFRATGKWVLQTLAGNTKTEKEVRALLKKYFRRLLHDIDERPFELDSFEWREILEFAERKEHFSSQLKSFLLEESFSKDSIRVKFLRIRVLKSPLFPKDKTQKDSPVRKILVRALAGFIADPAKRKAFRARHLNLDPRRKTKK